MNCEGCNAENCFSCGYQYGLEIKHRRRKNAQRRKAQRRRRQLRALLVIVATAAVVSMTIAAVWKEPDTAELPSLEAGEPAMLFPLPAGSDIASRLVPLVNHEELDAQTAYTAEEREILAIIIYQEAGADYCSDDTRLKVGTVFLNRVASDAFPNTFEEVATAKAQYGRLYWTGIQWPDRAAEPGEAHAVERSYEIADRLLAGERAFDGDPDVVWQAEFPQGSEVVAYQDGTYFCK